jgi:2-polyprenyl-3-methyl-5-hydroxy-6-metoxy-1,4-benzoquinol methylase
MLPAMPNQIQLGGQDTERLYLYDLDWQLPDGQRVVVRKSVISTDPDNTELRDEMIARHKGRYGLVRLFCRPKQRLLDFPCGSGYAAEILRPSGVRYEGLEFDEITVEYARRIYGDAETSFALGDLTKPALKPNSYDVIACIEGLEHIEAIYQSPLIAAFRMALPPGGVLVISSPENKSGRSGPSAANPDHLWELTRRDFIDLLHRHFDPGDVEVISHEAVLDPGGLSTCLYAVCHNR